MSIETMTKLFTTTVGAGGSSSVVFSNIPQNYTDLCIKISCRTSRAADEDGLGVQLNSSTTGQLYRIVAGSGDAVSSINTAYEPLWVCRIQGANAGSNIFSSTDLYISSYSANAPKVISADSVTEKSGTNAYLTLSSVLQPSPAPVTSITLSGIGGTLQQHSVFTLYGIKNARQTAGNSIKATGGNIVFDGTYVYHVFNATDTFVASQPLTATVVSVGGGGGGGWNNAGGGGGGEVDISSNISVAAGSSNVVVVGSGGATATSTASSGANGTTSSFASSVTSLGGGGGGTGDASASLRVGQTGGSGGGGSLDNIGGSASGSNTNAGGQGFAVGSGPERYAGGGGGGATAAGGNANTSTRVSGAGGQGYAVANIFSGFNLGAITHLGSGGSGGIYVNGNTGLAGTAGTNAGTGGQQSTSGNVNPTSPTPNAGGGGGGGSYTGVNSRQGSNGGSGIVIVRYKG